MSPPTGAVGQIFEDRATLHYEYDTCGCLHVVQWIPVKAMMSASRRISARESSFAPRVTY